jgi:hypothetical protein
MANTGVSLNSGVIATIATALTGMYRTLLSWVNLLTRTVEVEVEYSTGMMLASGLKIQMLIYGLPERLNLGVRHGRSKFRPSHTFSLDTEAATPPLPTKESLGVIRSALTAHTTWRTGVQYI